MVVHRPLTLVPAQSAAAVRNWRRNPSPAEPTVLKTGPPWGAQWLETLHFDGKVQKRVNARGAGLTQHFRRSQAIHLHLIDRRG